MRQGRLATYLHPQTVSSSRPREEIKFVGYSVPHFAQVREGLAERLSAYPSLPLRQADLADFRAVHAGPYLEQIIALAAGESPAPRPRLSAECAGLQHFLPGYCHGLGGMQEAIDQMVRSELDRAYCFSLGGHHAFPDWGHGYCLLNPLAAAVRYAQQRGFGRVLVIDYDIHHGDGTQAIFAHDPSVYCISLHSALDLYMAKVGDWRHGMARAGTGVGHCNLPVIHMLMKECRETTLRGHGRILLGEEAIPALREALAALPFAPDLITVFSGYDAHKDDCGRRITEWAEAEFVEVTQVILAVASRFDCPVLSVHGGGYNLRTALECAVWHVRTLADL